LAKKSDHLAGLNAEDTGGLFSNLLAEEEEFDARRLAWRLGSWGVGSVAAVVLAIMANQASEGWRRDKAMTADLVQQANRLQAVARESQNEARRLASAIETLNSDRDRLYTRVTVLEQGLDSVTGTIARQNAPATAAAQPDPQPALPPQNAAQPPAPPVAPVAAKPASPPEKTAAIAPAAAKPAPQPDQNAVVPVATKAAAQSDTKPAAQTEKAAATASAEPPPTTAAIKEVHTKPSAISATALVESKSMMAPPDPAAGKLIEPKSPSGIAVEPIPAVVAAAPSGESADSDAADAALPRIRRTEFGVDVGGANSVAGLRALWRGLLKSRSNVSLAALQPIIVIREGTGGRGMQLRLVAGPLSDAATAAKLCAFLSENDRDCETAVYEGQRLTFKADDAPPEAKPAAPVTPAAPPTSRRKNNSQKRASVQEAAKPAQTASTSWSFFGKRN
jgi:hypothetical protein